MNYRKEYLPRYTDFTDIPLRSKERAEQTFKDVVICPACKGHGSFNLLLDAYGKGRHFQGGCANCNGWGYVETNSPNAHCIHEYDYGNGKTIEHCLHTYKCKKCGHEIMVDSSD